MPNESERRLVDTPGTWLVDMIATSRACWFVAFDAQGSNSIRARVPRTTQWAAVPLGIPITTGAPMSPYPVPPSLAYSSLRDGPPNNIRASKLGPTHQPRIRWQRAHLQRLVVPLRLTHLPVFKRLLACLGWLDFFFFRIFVVVIFIRYLT